MDNINNELQLMSKKTFEVNHKKDKDFKKVEMHSHDFYELYFFLHGKASYIVDERKYSLSAGDVLLISPSNLHQLNIKDTSESYERIVLWINPEYLNEISTESTDLSVCFKIANDEAMHLIRNNKLSIYLKDEFRSLINNDNKRVYGSDIESEIHLKNILIKISEYLLNIDESIDLSKENKIVTSAIDYINSHLMDDLSLDLLSKELFINKYYLSHLFKEHTNISPHKYILKRRLMQSKELIKKGNKINSVYKECGFKDYTHFFKAFKDEYKLTPKEYQLLNK